MVKKNQGFTLIELMIVIAIIAIIAAIAIPNLLSARVSANESNAISTLRNLVSSEAQFQSSGAMDENSNGTGEYGSFGELSGGVNLQRNGVGVAARLNPPILPATFQVINGSGQAQKSGYLFLMYLPDIAGAGVPEVVTTGGPGATVDPNTCEAVWCCYAFPVTPGTTGNRAFFVNPDGFVDSPYIFLIIIFSWGLGTVVGFSEIIKQGLLIPPTPFTTLKADRRRVIAFIFGGLFVVTLIAYGIQRGSTLTGSSSLALGQGLLRRTRGSLPARNRLQKHFSG